METDTNLQDGINLMASDPTSAQRALWLAAFATKAESPSAYFQLGTCEMAMNRFDDAAQSFALARHHGHQLAGAMMALAVKELILELESRSAQGDVCGAARLAEIIGTGEFGVEKDFDRAVRLLRPHGETGALEAQKCLGGLIAQEHESQNVSEARMWLQRAFLQGDEWALQFSCSLQHSTNSKMM